MELVSNIEVHKIKKSGISEVNFNQLEFGKYTSDHMLVADFANGEWQTPKILPYANLSLSPAALALHYGQTVFEGMKAFRMANGSVNIFRIHKHHQRLTKSLHRMCMAEIPEDIFIEGLTQLIALDQDWVPSAPGTSLYIRPFMIATESRFGVKISDEYRFIIFTGPVPSIYTEPIKVKVETEFSRAAKGGTGFAKCGGNYGAAYFPTKLAKEQGYDQVLWTDSIEHKFIEESGMMNVMFVINETLVTPALSDSILDGITRDSLLTIAKDLGIKTEERPVSVFELQSAFENKTISEAFGAGTAAVVAPIKTIGINGTDFHLPAYSADSKSSIIKNKLEQIRAGNTEDIHGWNFIVP
ncbi:MAG: branched-chain amino acid aminotransferase [Bacteroidetes bacterium]|nr:branched-chain amino acid aminotransferase [Bacteroidota bacterium]